MKKVLVGLPLNLLVQIDATAEAECRTRSDLIREALRRYLEQHKRSQLYLTKDLIDTAFEQHVEHQAANTCSN